MVVAVFNSSSLYMKRVSVRLSVWLGLFINCSLCIDCVEGGKEGAFGSVRCALFLNV